MIKGRLALFFLCCFLPSAAHARFFAGNSFGLAVTKHHIKDADLHMKPGLSEVILFGYLFPRWRAEIEIGYTFNRCENLKVNGTKTAIKGSFQSLSAAYNARYLIPIKDRWSLAGGLGIGYVWKSFTRKRFPLRVRTHHESKFYQFLGGIHYTYSPWCEFSLDYKYWKPDEDIFGQVIALSVRRFF